MPGSSRRPLGQFRGKSARRRTPQDESPIAESPPGALLGGQRVIAVPDDGVFSIRCYGLTPIDALLPDRDDVRSDVITDSPMDSPRIWRRWRTRANFAGLIACLFIIGSLAHAVAPAFGEAAAEHGASSLRMVADCGTPRADQVPADERRDHCRCCILCSAGARDGTADVIAEPCGFAGSVPPKSDVSTISFEPHVAHLRRCGWMSSGSPRAPPRV